MEGDNKEVPVGCTSKMYWCCPGSKEEDSVEDGCH